MCGIIGILGGAGALAAPRILAGLERLSYRGYDSAGIATLEGGSIHRRRAAGKLQNLADKLARDPLAGTIGIGHTRWATHGGPTEENAHPHATDQVAVVHNGIIENYAALKAMLQARGAVFATQTDTEVIVHLVTQELKSGRTPRDAAFAAFNKLQGVYALALIFSQDPSMMIGVRCGTPLAVGYGEGEMFLASDSYALAPFTKKITFLEDGDRVVLIHDQADIYNAHGQRVNRPVRMTAQSGLTTGKGDYRHFMHKEIHEQPTVIADTLHAYLHPSTGHLAVDAALVEALAAAPRLTMTACGTAFYATYVARYWFEQLAGLPCDIDVASEFRYREAPLSPGGMMMVVSQSGETLDTLEALRYGQRMGQKIIAVVNTIESTIERAADFVLHTRAGPEIGVASTKAFTTQLTTLLCLALAVAEKRGRNIDSAAQALRHLPTVCAEILEFEETLAAVAAEMVAARDVLYLGRGLMYPLALEGALKLKEISYIHAEGYAAGEMKHGPIALIDDQVPVVVLAPSSVLFEKTLSNIQEARARGGQILLISDQAGVKAAGDLARWSVVVPDTDAILTPITYALPVQMLAYHVATLKGTDVDQPRNLAKSVTVE
jgi:glucosamine--fructose-6-phosphate aminotransferase (isomerizing)